MSGLSLLLWIAGLWVFGLFLKFLSHLALLTVEMVEEYRTLREVADAFSHPPLHDNCRCQLVPVDEDLEVIDWDNYDDDFRDHLMEAERLIQEASDAFERGDAE